MKLTKRIRLKPTTEQLILFNKSAGASRWAYNYVLSEKERVYQEYLDNNKQGVSSISIKDIRKNITVLKQTTHPWLKEVGVNVVKQAAIDADNAYKKFFKKKSGKPRKKSKYKDKLSFYVNYESLSKTVDGFHGERLGFVKTSEPLPDIPKNEKYSNPHISFDGKYWYLTIGYDIPENKVEHTGEVIGIDLGIKELAVCSNGKFYKNINKTPKIKKLKKKLRREQRKLSRMMNFNIVGYDSKHRPIFNRPLKECKNYQKQKHVIKLIHRTINNIRTNYLHQVTTEIVKTLPSRVVMEDLNIKGMMKNKYLAEVISEQKLYQFKKTMKYKCCLYGIEFVEADRTYASSKLCSHCGNKKSDLKLSDRKYICPHCGLIIDRDLNASINLANYKVK